MLKTLGGGNTENTINNIENSGATENIIKSIKKGGQSIINLNIYLFDCVNSSSFSNTDSFDFDCVNFNFDSLHKDFCTQTNFIVMESTPEASKNFHVKKQPNFLVKRSMNFPVKKQKNILVKKRLNLDPIVQSFM